MSRNNKITNEQIEDAITKRLEDLKKTTENATIRAAERQKLSTIAHSFNQLNFHEKSALIRLYGDQHKFQEKEIFDKEIKKSTANQNKAIEKTATLLGKALVVANAFGFGLILLLNIVPVTALLGHAALSATAGTDLGYATFTGLCALNAVAGSAIGAELHQKEMKQDARALISTSALVFAAVTTYIVTSPVTHIIANALASTLAPIGLSAVFVTCMSVAAGLEIGHVRRGNALVKEWQEELDNKLTGFDTFNKTTPESKLKADEKTEKLTEINFLRNAIAFEKFQVAEHKKNAWIWGSSAALIAGSTTLTILAIAGVAIAGGALTMGAVPAALALIGAGLAILRWYRATHPPKIELPVKAQELATAEPKAEELIAEKEKQSNMFGLFSSPAKSHEELKESKHESNDKGFSSAMSFA